MQQSDIINGAFSPLYGKPCWNVQHGWGSQVTLEFGKPHLIIDEPREPLPAWSPDMNKRRARRLVTVRGTWHLRIYCCEWQVLTGTKRIGHSNLKDSSKKPIERGAKEPGGQKLIGVSVNSHMGTSVFTFDLGSRMDTKPYDASVQWTLFEPNGDVVRYRGDGRYSHQPGDTRPEQSEDP